MMLIITILILDILLNKIQGNWLSFSMLSSQAIGRYPYLIDENDPNKSFKNNGRHSRDEPSLFSGSVGRTSYDYGDSDTDLHINKAPPLPQTNQEFPSDLSQKFPRYDNDNGHISRNVENNPAVVSISSVRNDLLKDCPETLKGHLVNSQIEVCRRHPESLPSVTQGARMALSECQQQFRNERWNCSTAIISNELAFDSAHFQALNKLYNKQASEHRENDIKTFKYNRFLAGRKRIRRVGSHFYGNEENSLDKRIKELSYPELRHLNFINLLSKTLEKGTKESAFIYATASAAVVYAITQSCSAGNLTDCNCKSPNEHDRNVYLETDDGITGKSEWKWGGCSDNVEYGIRFSQEFVDAPDREKVKTLLKFYGSSLIEKNTTASRRAFKEAMGADDDEKTSNQLFPIMEEGSGGDGGQKVGGKRFFISVNESAPIFSYPYKRPNKQIVRHIVNLHNNQLGRKVVSDLVRKQCRCHGVSGSCELKTCWLNMSPFTLIGSNIKSKYYDSVRVAPKLIIKQKPAALARISTDISLNDNLNKPGDEESIDDIENSIMLQRKKPKYINTRDTTNITSDFKNDPFKTRRFNGKNKEFTKYYRLIEQGDMVHLDKSPNYCNPDPGSGIIGTRGRECRVGSSGPDSCDQLCCGRGYSRTTLSVTERCDCKFHWCCYVECNNCTTSVYHYTCN